MGTLRSPKGGDFTWHLSTNWVHDFVAKMNFRTHQSTDQESLLVKKGEYTSRHGCTECPNIMGIYGEKVNGGLAKIHFRISVLSCSGFLMQSFVLAVALL
jgi:hypothetical protein